MSTNCVLCIVNERTGSDLFCNSCREKESLKELAEVEELLVGKVPEEKKVAAAEFLARELPEETKKSIKNLIEKGKDRFWFSAHHFISGMQIRNLLRVNAFGEEGLGINNLDYIYCELLERAVMGSKVEWDETEAAQD